MENLAKEFNLKPQCLEEKVSDSSSRIKPYSAQWDSHKLNIVHGRAETDAMKQECQNDLRGGHFGATKKLKKEQYSWVGQQQ